MVTTTLFGGRFVKNWTLFLSFAMVFCLVVCGCGGGSSGGESSDGGGSGGSSPGLTYSGATNQAVVTADNSQALVVNAMDAGAGGAGISGIAGLDTVNHGQDATGRPLFLGLAVVMESAIARMDRQSAAEQNPASAVESDADTYPGSCGGSYSYNIQVDTDSGVFSGNLSFNGFCEEGITLNGSASFSGVVNVTLRQVETCTVSFNSLTGTSGSGSVTMGGQVYLAVSGAATMITMDMMVRDNGDGRVCKIENYQMDIADHGAYSVIVVNGRYYDPDYGYVDLETTSALVVDDDDDYPRIGQLILTGANGAAGGPTAARLTALSETQCRVEADTDGDGIYDYDSGAVLWTDL
jgi:hypothetical protein